MPACTQVTRVCLAIPPAVPSFALEGLLKCILVYSRLIHKTSLAHANQQLIINTHPNCSSPPHARIPGTSPLVSANPLGFFSSAISSGPARSQERAHRHFYPLLLLQGRVLAGTPAPRRGTVITSERVLYFIKQLPPVSWGAVYRDTRFCF